jgi:hypothetical protein
MSQPSPAEILSLQDELQRLLALGQPPSVAAEMRIRFIETTLPLGTPAWTAFTFPVALALVQQVPSLSLLGIAPQWVDSLRELVGRLRWQTIPSWSSSIDWPDLCARALERLDRPEPPIGEQEIGIPVIARQCGGETTHALFAGISMGCMLRLRVEVDVSERSGSKPDLVIEGEAAPATRAAFESAMRELSAMPAWGAPRPQRCAFRATWGMPGARLVGGSGGLAFLFAAALARARLSPSLWQRSLLGPLAATGDLRGTLVVPVDPEGLATKVEAAYHSRARFLLVPKSQEMDAARAAASLEDESPGHHLEVVGVDDVRDLWSDTRVVRRDPRTVAAFTDGALRWFTRSRARIALLLAVPVAMASAFVFIGVRWQKDPVAAEWQDGRLTMRNRYGHAWSMEIRYPPGPTAFHQVDLGAPLLVVHPSGFRHAIVVTILGATEGRTERLAAVLPSGAILWEIDARRISARHKTPIEDFNWTGIYDDGPDPDGSVRFYALRRSIQWNPTLIDRIDAATGASRGCLYNHGHLEYSSRIDLDHDGRPETIFLGTHNPDSCGIAVVVDPGRMRAIAFGDSLGSLPDIAGPAALSNGVAACWRFPNDRFSSAIRATCMSVYPDGEGIVKVAVTGNPAEGSYLYRLRTIEPGRPAVLGIQMTDGYRAFLDRVVGNSTLAGLAAAEDLRLMGKAMTLTPGGWTRMRQIVTEDSERGAEKD